MFFTQYKTNSGEKVAALYDSTVQLIRDTFSPDTGVPYILEFKIVGNTYAERKERLREIAQEFQHADEGGLSWGEYAWIVEWFSKNGKRYGLIDEFRENCIC